MMKKILSFILAAFMLLSGAVLAEEAKAPLSIAEQGMFSAGGTVTEPVEGDYNPTTNWLDVTRAGNTAHVDHANVLYQIPVNDNGHPIVYLHGYGQSRMGWMTTPDGREGWATYFLRNGHSAYLVDQPGRGEAGAQASMSTDGFLDVWSEDSKAFDLDEAIPDVDQHTRLFELGGLAYWYPGPSVAIFHSNHLEQTIVPVVTIGRITDDVSSFADYEGSISIALVP